MSLSKTIRLILVFLFTLCVAPPIGDFFVELARQRGAYDNPEATVSVFWNSVLGIAGAWWYPWLCGGLGGLVIGTWLDWFARSKTKIPPTPKEMAVEFANQLHVARNHLRPILEIRRLKLDARDISYVKSAYVTGKKSGYPTPSVYELNEKQFCELNILYIDTVSPFLWRGHIKEAKQAAKTVCREIAISAGQKRQSLLGTAIEKLRKISRATACF